MGSRRAGRIIAIFFGVIFWLIGFFSVVLMLFSIDYSTKIWLDIIAIFFFGIATVLSIVASRLKTPKRFGEQRYS